MHNFWPGSVGSLRHERLAAVRVAGTFGHHRSLGDEMGDYVLDAHSEQLFFSAVDGQFARRLDALGPILAVSTNEIDQFRSDVDFDTASPNLCGELWSRSNPIRQLPAACAEWFVVHRCNGRVRWAPEVISPRSRGSEVVPSAKVLERQRLTGSRWATSN